MSSEARGSTRRPASTPQTELNKWLNRPGLVDDLHRLAAAEPEIIAVLMAACARHPAPITDPSPIPSATPFSVVFLEKVTEAIEQGIPVDDPQGTGVPGAASSSAIAGRTVWQPQPKAGETSSAAQEQAPPSTPLRRPHGRVLHPDEIIED